MQIFIKSYNQCDAIAHAYIKRIRAQAGQDKHPVDDVIVSPVTRGRSLGSRHTVLIYTKPDKINVIARL